MDKKKILIVDDEKDTLFILERGLAARGYSVITADNGYDAIVLAKSKRPDLIILDIAMPDMDGGEVSGRLKEDPKTKDIPIMFLTALVSKAEEKKKDHLLAGNVLIAKPYGIEELLTQIEMLLSGKRVCAVNKANDMAK